MPIEVIDYDAAWPDQAAAACTDLLTALPGVFVAIEHFGSTSVPGLVTTCALTQLRRRGTPALKRQIAGVIDSGDDYTRAKTDLIQELTDAARAERGLPSAPVWGE